MIKHLAALLMLLMIFPSTGQKIEKEYYKLPLVKNPELTLPKECKTFNVEIINNSQGTYSPLDLKLDPMSISDTQGDITLVIELGPVDFDSTGIFKQESRGDMFDYFTIAVNYSQQAAAYLQYNYLPIRLGSELVLPKMEMRLEYEIQQNPNASGKKVLKEDGRFYLYTEEEPRTMINDRFLAEAMSMASGTWLKYLPQDTVFNAEISKLKDKKVDYSAFNEGAGEIQTGIAQYIAGDISGGRNVIMSGVQKQLPFLDQIDLDDKKAFINSKRGAPALLYNLVFSHVFLGEYDKAKEYIGKMHEMKLRVPGDFYYDEAYLKKKANEIDRINELINAPEPKSFSFSVPDISIVETTKVEDGILNKLSGSLGEDQMFLLNTYGQYYGEGNPTDVPLLQMLYGNEPEAAIRKSFNLNRYDGVHLGALLTSYDEVNTSYFKINFRYDQARNLNASGFYHVWRMMDENGQWVQELAYPEGHFIDEAGYRIYDNVEMKTWMPTKTYTLSYDVFEKLTDGAFAENLPADFPIGEFKQKRVKIEFQWDGTQFNVVKSEVKEGDVKVKVANVLAKTIVQDGKVDAYKQMLKDAQGLGLDAKANALVDFKKQIEGEFLIKARVK